MRHRLPLDIEELFSHLSIQKLSQKLRLILDVIKWSKPNLVWIKQSPSFWVIGVKLYLSQLIVVET